MICICSEYTKDCQNYRREKTVLSTSGRKVLRIQDDDDEDDGPHLTRTGISGAGESNVKHHARRHIGSC